MTTMRTLELTGHLLDSGLMNEILDRVTEGGGTFEVTRFCLDRSLCARDRRAARDTLIVALAEHALASGIDTYTAVADMQWFQQIQTFGWTCHLLGAPREIDGELMNDCEIVKQLLRKRRTPVTHQRLVA